MNSCAGICLLVFCSFISSGLSAEAPQQNKGRATPAKPARSPEEEATEELGRLVAEAANNHALLVKNLEGFLKRFPNHPRKPQIYRALVEALLQLQEPARALEYAERLIGQQPDDSSMMLLAVDLLEQMGDERSILKAAGYATRVLDRVEKAPPSPAPAGLSPDQWSLEQKTMHMSVYIIRGRLFMRQRNFEKAAADFAASYAVLPNATSQLRLGEIAELRSEYPSAIQHYLAAFLMPVNYGAAVDRPDVRRKLGNVWRLVHGSEEGLGARLLSAYDELAGTTPTVAPGSSASGDFYEVAARLQSGAAFSLTGFKGNIVVAVFCAEWSLPCREMQTPFEQFAAGYANTAQPGDSTTRGLAALYVAANEADLGPARLGQSRSSVTRFVSEELLRVMKVDVVPTVVVLDVAGNLRARWTGYSPAFVNKLQEAVTAARAVAN